jgi:DNA-binding transcriptional regulator YiaG
MTPSEMRRRRELVGLTVGDVALHLDLSPYIVQGWETGELPLSEDWEERLTGIFRGAAQHRLPVKKAAPLRRRR